MVLDGEAGVGKTALWRSALDAAPERGWRTLISAPAGSEARFSFAALGDLLDREIDDTLPSLPEPQRKAMEVALLRREDSSGRSAIDERMIGVATLSALRALTARTPVLVAIDDLQWVDAPSACALGFALRRLRDEPVLVLATRRLEQRPRAGLEVERMLGDERVRRLRIAPLSLGGVHELLLTRLGFDASRPTLLRVYELTAGNPFFALEIGRELAARGIEPVADEPLPVPGTVRQLVQARLERLSPPARSALLASAALIRPTLSLLARLDEHADAALDEAVAAGLIELSGERVRFVHPLLASIHYEQTPLAERRRTHARLSAIVEDPEERARHLALATASVDENVATQLDDAGRAAALRGAPQSAAELCDLAARLTPARSDRAERLIAAAEHHQRAGNLGLAGERAREALNAAIRPPVRARALGVLGTVAADTEGTEAAVAAYRLALREPGAPRDLRADLHQKLAWICLVGADARGAECHARAMLRLAEGVDPTAEAAAAATFSLAVSARGRPVPPRLLRTVTAAATASRERPWAWSETSPAALTGVVLLWSGELEQAREPLRAMYRTATESADPWLEMHALAYLSSLETGLGRPAYGWSLARRYLELAVATDQAAQRAGALWPVAVAATWLGRTGEAKAAAREGLALAKRTGHGLYVIGHLSALGAAELSVGEPAAAEAALGQAWALAHRGGVESPARFPMLPDYVEALLMIGEHARAAMFSGELERIARRLARPWALALAGRCDALVAEARGDDDAAVAGFERAVGEHSRQDRPLDRARTLLAYGALHRRRRRRRLARELLERARAIFEAAEAAQWAERACAELGRIGGRPAAAPGSLTATEAAIAKLVASGRTNREVAAALQLSARTVEWNLSKLYRKLGVHSRTQLAMALRGDRTESTIGQTLDPSPPARIKSGDFPG